MEEERGEVKTDAEEVFSTKKPVAKKKKREQSNGNGESGFSDILAVIQVLAKKQDDSFSKISAIELTTNSTAKQIEKLTSTVEQLVMDVECHKEILKTTQLEVENLKKEGQESLTANGKAGGGRSSYMGCKRKLMKIQESCPLM